MNEFIHTFSLTAHLFKREKDLIEKTFCNDFSFNRKKKVLKLNKYAECGVRLNFEYTPKLEKKYDKEHRDCKLEIIVTPAKLLYPGEKMSKLFNEDEYITACNELKTIIEEIEKLSGVSIWKEVKMKRIDITKDVETPSEKYSDEIIRLAKKSMCKAGCHIWKPTEDEVAENGWLEKDSILFYNHNQGVKSKIYNKAIDLKNQSSDIKTENGLIRLETSLKRQFLKANDLISSDFIEIDKVGGLLCQILQSSESILKKYITDSFFEGRMLSKKLQKKAIQRYCNNKKERLKKMLAYRDACNKGLQAIDDFDAQKRGRLNDHFKKLNLSPIYASPDFECVPAFSDLLGYRSKLS